MPLNVLSSTPRFLRRASLLLFSLCLAGGYAEDFYEREGNACCEKRGAWLVEGSYSSALLPCTQDNIGALNLYWFSEPLGCGGHLFLTGSGYYHADHKWGSGAGVGFRQPLFDNSWILGAYGYYDYQSLYSHNLNQIGLGLELLSACWNARANFYLPVGSKAFTQQTFFFDDYIGDFEATCWVRRRTAKAVDLELERHFCLSPCLGLDIAVGGYGLYHHNCSDVYGVYERARATLRCFYVEAEACHDRMRDSQAGLKIGFTCPLEELNRICMLAFQPLKRRNYICTKRCCIYETNF